MSNLKRAWTSQFVDQPFNVQTVRWTLCSQVRKPKQKGAPPSLFFFPLAYSTATVTTPSICFQSLLLLSAIRNKTSIFHEEEQIGSSKIFFFSSCTIQNSSLTPSFWYLLLHESDLSSHLVITNIYGECWCHQ